MMVFASFFIYECGFLFAGFSPSSVSCIIISLDSFITPESKSSPRGVYRRRYFPSFFSQSLFDENFFKSVGYMVKEKTF